MNKRTLGISNIKVSEIGLGCMGMTHAYGKQRNKIDMITLIQKAIQLGCNFFDTAVVYGQDNEKYLGEALTEHRKDVVIATKYGITGQSHDKKQPINKLDSRPETIKKQLNESLERLNTDYIDLYYQHRVDPKVKPETVANIMQEFIDDGLIRAWGLSNAPIEYLRKAHETCPISAIKNQYSMLYRSQEKELFQLCEELNLAFVAYSPLGNGFLTGKYDNNTEYDKDDFRNTMARFSDKTVKNNQKLLEIIKELAQQKECTMAQIVLSWELTQKPFIIPIPGSTNRNRLEENINSTNIKLSMNEMEEINTTLSRINVDESFF